MNRLTKWTMAATVGALLLSSGAWADPIADLTCGNDLRSGRMDSAEACSTGDGNPNSSDLVGYWPGDSWTDKGHIAGDFGSLDAADEYLSWEFTSGQWGGGSFEGVWTIADEFWTMFSEAVITFHVGHGNVDAPDHFAFLITPGDTTGVLEYILGGGNGGGFSNLRLWGRGEGGTSVPEPGSMALLGIGLLGLGAARRRRKQA